MFDGRCRVSPRLSAKRTDDLFTKLNEPLGVPIVEQVAERFNFQAQTFGAGDGEVECSGRPGLPRCGGRYANTGGDGPVHGHVLVAPDLGGYCGRAVRGLAVQEGQHCSGQQRSLYYHPGPGVKAADRLFGQGVWLHSFIQPISVGADRIRQLRKSGLDIANLTFVCKWLDLLDLDGERVNARNKDLCRPWTKTATYELLLSMDREEVTYRACGLGREILLAASADPGKVRLDTGCKAILSSRTEILLTLNPGDQVPRQDSCACEDDLGPSLDLTAVFHDMQGGL